MILHLKNRTGSFGKKRSILFFVFCCVIVLPISSEAQTSTDVLNRRAQLEQELLQLEQQIAAQRSLLISKQRESVSLERDIAILDAQIDKAKLEIRARDISISKLVSEIQNKNTTIGDLDAKIDREHQSLGALLRRTRELDSASMAELFFVNGTLSEFFNDVENFEAIQGGLQSSFNEVRETRALTVEEKIVLEGKRLEEVELKKLQELERRRLEDAEKEKAGLLKATRGEESRYQSILKDQEKSAAQIRAELFTLQGSAAIPFGKALDYANLVSEKTGIRPAFLLGVIAEETNLGANVGTGTWRIDMHPTRDQPIFPYILQALGLNPDIMPVSRKPGYGWGGAMGPAQFIPSTWVCYGGFINVTTGDCDNKKRSLGWDLFWQGPWQYVAEKDRIGGLIGKASPSNPWEPLDAFMAAGMLLRENGGAGGNYASERLSALRYFAGWTNATKATYAFYGDDVMALATKYQGQIDLLQGR